MPDAALRTLKLVIKPDPCGAAQQFKAAKVQPLSFVSRFKSRGSWSCFLGRTQVRSRSPSNGGSYHRAGSKLLVILVQSIGDNEPY